MRITKVKVAEALVKSCLMTDKDIELTSKQLSYFKADNALEKAMFDRAKSFIFSQAFPLQDIDSGREISYEFHFLVTRKREYRLMLITSNEQRERLKNFFSLNNKGGA